MNKFLLTAALLTLPLLAADPTPKDCCKSGKTPCCSEKCCKASDHCCKGAESKKCAKPCKDEAPAKKS